MEAPPIRLRTLLRERHWQKHATFCREYDKAAGSIDPDLKGTWPSRAQLHRWLSGELKGLPYPDHCRILEKMLPGWSVQQLFEPVTEGSRPTGPAGAESSELEELLRAIAAGLDAPDSELGDWGSSGAPTAVSASRLNVGPTPVDPLPLALSDHGLDGVSETTQRIGRKLIAVARVLRLSPAETKQLASLAGSVVDLDQRIDIDIQEDGEARLTYRHELFNMSSRPLTRLARELWFENTDGRLVISPANAGRQVVIQRIHDTANLAKFACQISPAIQPGESVTIGYSCEGGRFIKDHYWRQSLPRYTRHLTINLRHRGANRLVSCVATEEHPDGSENSAMEQLLWDYEADYVLVTLTRDYLRPNQAVTLRWEVSHEPA